MDSYLRKTRTLLSIFEINIRLCVYAEPKRFLLNQATSKHPASNNKVSLKNIKNINKKQYVKMLLKQIGA